MRTWHLVTLKTGTKWPTGSRRPSDHATQASQWLNRGLVCKAQEVTRLEPSGRRARDAQALCYQ